MKFDWYQCSISESPIRALESIRRLGETVKPNDRVGKMYRYTQGFEVLRKNGSSVAFVAMGGRNGEDHVHAWATSDDAEDFASLVREEWPEQHLVTRADSCQDFVDPGAFKLLTKIARKIAKNNRMKFPKIEDSLNLTAGKTQYIGSPSSDYRARIYEKGWELWSKLNPRIRDIINPDNLSMEVPSLGRDCHPADWVRLEIQARPKGIDARKKASTASPEEIWTFTSWSAEYAREALALDLERYYVRSRKEPDGDRALRFMCQQYARVLTALKNDLGGWECVGMTIGEMIKADELKRK